MLALEQKRKLQQALLANNNTRQFVNFSNDGLMNQQNRNRLTMLQMHGNRMNMQAVQKLKNKRITRSQPGELNERYLAKRSLLGTNPAIDTLDIKFKKKKIQKPNQQTRIVAFP